MLIMTIELTAAVIGYLCGSIPFGLLLSKWAGYGDIRDIGSGNIGTTNVLRTGDKKLAFFTLLLDGGKGAFAVLIVSTIGAHEAALVAGLFAVIGHMFPVWLKFKGGKGMATTLGTLLALASPVGLAALATWVFMALVFRYSSLSALLAVMVTPPVSYLIYADQKLAGICALIALLVWIRHRGNIKRLLTGQEPKIGKSKAHPIAKAAPEQDSGDISA